jgi:hypothetical protein
MSQGTWHKIVLKAGPDTKAASNGIGLWLRKGETGDADPQPGFTLKIQNASGALEDLAVPADGKITLAENDLKWQQLTSLVGLTLLIQRDENVKYAHDLSLHLLKKHSWQEHETVRLVSMAIVPVEFEVTKWEPVITQPVEPYTTGENRNPPANEIDDAAFVAEPPDGKKTFVVKADVKLKPLAMPADDFARIASEWKVAILQNVVELPTADYRTYIGQPGAAGSFVLTLAPVPGMDALSFAPTPEFPDPNYPNPDDQFPFQRFVTGNETLSMEYDDTPAPTQFGGAPIYKNDNTDGITLSTALTNLKRDVTFVTWVYAEHVPSKTRTFLKWVRWQTSWDVDIDATNFAPPALTKKTYIFRKIDEGEGEGPVQPTFRQAQGDTLFVPAP